VLFVTDRLLSAYQARLNYKEKGGLNGQNLYPNWEVLGAYPM